MQRLDLLTSDDLPVTLGQLTLCVLRGQGSTGRVFRSETRGVGGLPRVVAVTVLRPSTRPGGVDAWGPSLADVHRARLLRHRGIVQTYSCGERDGLPFAVTELVDGVGLDELVRTGGALPPRNALDTCIQVAAALSAAHELRQGSEALPLVHGDLRPSRVMVGVDGVVKLRGFGLGGLVTQGAADGTPRYAYVPPEVLRGGAPDLASDIFSLGAILAWSVLGRNPFSTRQDGGEEAVAARVERVLRGGRIVSEVDAIVPGLGPTLARLLAPDPAARARSATDAEASMRELRGSLPRGEGLGRVVQRWFGRDVGGATIPGGPPEPLLPPSRPAPPPRKAPPAVRSGPPPRQPARKAPAASSSSSIGARTGPPQKGPAAPPVAPVSPSPPVAPPVAPAPPASPLPGRPAPPPIPVPRREIVAAPRPNARVIPDETPTDPGRPDLSLESLDVIPAVPDGEVAVTGAVEIEPARAPAPPAARPGPASLGPDPGPRAPAPALGPPSFGSGGGLPAAPPLATAAVASSPEATDPWASSAGMAPLASSPPSVAPLRPAPPARATAAPRPVPGPPAPRPAPGPPAPRPAPGPPAPQLPPLEEEPDEDRGGGARSAVRLLAALVIVLGVVFIGLQLALRAGLFSMPGSDGPALPSAEPTLESEPTRLEPPTRAEVVPIEEPTDDELSGPALTEAEQPDPADPDPLVEPTSGEPEGHEPISERGSRAAPPDWRPEPEATVREPITRRPDPEPVARRPGPEPTTGGGAAGPVTLDLSHRAIVSGASGASDLVSVRIQGAPRDTVVTLHFGPAGGPFRTSKLRGKSGGRWEGWLSFDAASGEQIVYWIVATHPAADGPASAGSSSRPFVVQVK